MKRRGSKREQTRKISKTGSYTDYVTIPKAILRELGWRERQRVVVKRKGKSVVIRDWKK